MKVLHLAPTNSTVAPIRNAKSSNDKGQKRKREADPVEQKQQQQMTVIDEKDNENSLAYWKMLAKAFDCDDACSADESDMMEELLQLCTWFEERERLVDDEETSDEDDDYIRNLMREDAQKKLAERMRERQLKKDKLRKKKGRTLPSEDSVSDILRMDSRLNLNSPRSIRAQTRAKQKSTKQLASGSQASTSDRTDSFSSFTASTAGNSQASTSHDSSLLAGAFCGVFASEFDNASSTLHHASIATMTITRQTPGTQLQTKDDGDFWTSVEF